MKKIMTLVLVIVMLATLCLTGCQPAAKPTDPTNGTDAPDTKPTTEATEPQLEEKTIQIWISGAGKQKDSDKVYAAFNELLKKYVPNTTVEFSNFPFGEYGEKFTQMIAGEEAVDLAWAGWVVNKPNNIKDENLMPLDDLIANYGKDIVEVLGQGVMDAHVYYDGKTYLIPSWQGLFGDRHAIYLVTDIVNLISDKDWAKKAEAAAWKFDEEPTVANLEAFMNLMEMYYAAAKNAGKIGAGADLRGYTGWNWGMGTSYQAAVAGIHVMRNDPDFKAVNHFGTDVAAKMFEILASWYDKGYMRSDFISAEGLGKIKDGKITDTTYISYGDGYWSEDSVQQQKDAWGCDVTAITRSSHGYVIQGYDTGMVIPYCADEPERAMMVLNAIYANKDLYNLLIFGIEGEHYTVNADGSINTSYTFNSSSSEDAYSVARWVIGSCKQSYVNTGMAPDYYTKLEAAEKDPSTKVSVWLTYQNDATKYEEWSAALSAVNKKYGSGNNIIAAGSKGWKAQYDAWMKELADAGQAKKDAAIQAMIDAWRKDKNVTGWYQN